MLEMIKNMGTIAIWKYILSLFLTWKIILLFITFLGLSTLPNYNPHTNELNFPSPDIDYWIRWSNWDGGHFRGIAENGYLPQQTVFFPAYPILIKFLMFFGVNSLWAGLVVSNICTLIAIYYLYKICLLDFNHLVAKQATFIFLIFPTSFYLGAVYSESLFLASTLGAFYYARLNKWMIASILVTIAVTTRLVGIGVLTALLLEYLIKNKNFYLLNISKKFTTQFYSYLFVIITLYQLFAILLLNFKLYYLFNTVTIINQILIFIFLILTVWFLFHFLLKNIEFKHLGSKPFFYLSFSITPLVIYSLFQNQLFGSPVKFITEEANWNRYLTIPWQTIINHINNLIFQIQFNQQILQLFIPLIFLIFYLYLFIFMLRKIRFSYCVFAFIALIIPLCSGNLVSMHRFGVVIFPIFIYIALINNKLLINLYLLISIVLLGLLSIAYINGYWIG